MNTRPLNLSMCTAVLSHECAISSLLVDETAVVEGWCRLPFLRRPLRLLHRQHDQIRISEVKFRQG